MDRFRFFATAAIPVRLAHPCHIIRAGLTAILSPYPDFRILPDEQTDFSAADDLIVIADYGVGLAAARATRARQAVLILTTRDKEWEVREAIDSGVRGYLLHGCSADELIDALYLLASGACHMTPMAVRKVDVASTWAALTPRENDVLRALACGCSDKSIARKLSITPGTVKSHIKHLLRKLDATARTHAVIIAIERGLLAEPPTAGLPSMREINPHLCMDPIGRHAETVNAP